jgi:8-oxo-dGTP pyrophosphatase MutT (NUDIX family)
VLVIKSWLSLQKWSLPGGGIGRGEDELAGAVREVREELGLRIKPAKFRHIGIGKHDSLGIKYTFHLYVVDVPRKLPFKKQPLEAMEARWMSSKRLNAETADQDMLQAFEIYNTTLPKSRCPTNPRH